MPSINDLFGSDESDSEAERDAERGTSAAAGGDARTREDEDEDEENDEEDSGEGAAASAVDGYVPPAGTRLKEPRGRKAPVRTAWDELRNGYIRTDPNETGRPRGTAPSGYVFVESINGFRRTWAQTQRDESIATETAQRASSMPRDGFFGPECQNRSLIEISWYCGAMGQHAPIRWFLNLIVCFTAICNHAGSATAMSIERGDRKQLQHIQGVSRFITSEAYKDQFRAFMKRHLGILTGGNIRCKIGINYFSGQTWENMLGYVQKDEGKPHYRFWSIGVTEAERRAGVASYQLVRRECPRHVVGCASWRDVIQFPAFR